MGERVLHGFPFKANAGVCSSCGIPAVVNHMQFGSEFLEPAKDVPIMQDLSK